MTPGACVLLILASLATSVGPGDTSINTSGGPTVWQAPSWGSMPLVCTMYHVALASEEFYKIRAVISHI